MRKVVVTGGAGFIGSHLVEELTRRGFYVVILDDLSTGKMENIEHLLKSGNVEFTQGSITDLPLLQKLFQSADYVFHQAAIASVPQSIENPLNVHEINATGTLNVILAAKGNSVKKVLYASSSSIYGDASTLPIGEETLPNPQSPYAVTKLAGECYCRVFQEVYGLPSVCLRYFNVYGPRQDPSSPYAAVIPRFISRVSEGSPPIIFGDGDQTRDFVFVKDAVEANILAAENNATGVFNIGTGKSTTINDLSRLVISIMGQKLEPIRREPQAGDIRHSLANVSRARDFGFSPRHSLEMGLEETISRFQHC